MLRGVAAVALLTGQFAAGPTTTAADTWSGRYSVYASDVYSAQHTNYTCVGASIQMMLNIIRGETDHSPDVQRIYWRFGSEHNRYVAPNNGVDPDGWIAALENFGAGSYAINLATDFQSGLRSLASAIRTTGRPVGLFVDHGGHAWVMTGFAATADPATAASFRVTSVQVMGPLYPDGTVSGRHYDPAPGRWLTASRLRAKFDQLQWKRAPEWSDRWVSVVPV